MKPLSLASKIVFKGSVGSVELWMISSQGSAKCDKQFILASLLCSPAPFFAISERLVCPFLGACVDPKYYVEAKAESHSPLRAVVVDLRRETHCCQ